MHKTHFISLWGGLKMHFLCSFQYRSLKKKLRLGSSWRHWCVHRAVANRARWSREWKSFLMMMKRSDDADDKTVPLHPQRWQIICFSIKHLSNNSFLWPLLAPTIHPLTRRQLPLRSGASQFKVSRKEGELGLGELVLCHWKNPSSSPSQWSWSGLGEEYNLSSLPILFVVVMTKRSCLNHHTYQEDPVRNTRKHDLTIELWIRMVKQRFKGFSWPNREHFGFAATESTKAKKRRQLTFGYYPGQSVRICSH